MAEVIPIRPGVKYGEQHIGRLTPEMWRSLPPPCQRAIADLVDGVLVFWEDELREGLAQCPN